jgi:hypothetical protein
VTPYLRGLLQHYWCWAYGLCCLLLGWLPFAHTIRVIALAFVCAVSSTLSPRTSVRLKVGCTFLIAHVSATRHFLPVHVFIWNAADLLGSYVSAILLADTFLRPLASLTASRICRLPYGKGSLPLPLGDFFEFLPPCGRSLFLFRSSCLSLWEGYLLGSLMATARGLGFLLLPPAVSYSDSGLA